MNKLNSTSFLALLSLVVGCSSPSDVVTKNQRAVSVDESAEQLFAPFSFALPEGESPENVMFSASQSITIDSRTNLGDPGGLPFLVSGESRLSNTFGADTSVRAHMVTVGDAFLGSRAHLFGDIEYGGALSQQDGVHIDGTIVHNGDVALTSVQWQVPWPKQALTDVVHPPDAPNQLLAPGGFSSVHLMSRGTLTLTAGVYHIESLVVEPEAHLRADTSGGPILLYVGGTLRLHTGIEYTEPEPEQLLIAYSGTDPALFQEAIVAAVISPNATIELRRPASGLPHKGTFFGRNVHAFSDATVLHEPIDLDTLCASVSPGVVEVGGALADLFAGREVLPSGKRLETRPTIPIKFSGSVLPAQLHAYLRGRVSKKYGGDCSRDPGGARKWNSVPLRAVETELSTDVNFITETALQPGCKYELHVTSVAAGGGGLCPVEDFVFDQVLVEFSPAYTVEERDFVRVVSRPSSDTWAVFEAREGINAPVKDAIERYLANMGLDPKHHSFGDPQELRQSTLRPGLEEGYHQQLLDGVPIRGHGLRIWSEDGIFRSAYADLIPTVVDSTPAIDEGTALNSLLAHSGLAAPYPWLVFPEEYTTPKGTLVIGPKRERDSDAADYQLEWRFDFRGSGTDVLGSGRVDASNSQVLADSPGRHRCALSTGAQFDDTMLRNTPTGPLRYADGSNISMLVHTLYDGDIGVTGTEFSQLGSDFSVFARGFPGWSFEVGVTSVGPIPGQPVTDGAIECDYEGDSDISIGEKDVAYDIAASVFAVASHASSVMEAAPFQWNGSDWVGTTNYPDNFLQFWVGPQGSEPTAYFDGNSTLARPRIAIPTDIAGGKHDATLSVIAHEMGHAIDTGILAAGTPAAGEYSGESGALVEGFAQIMMVWMQRESFQDPLHYFPTGGDYLDLRDPESQNLPGYYEISPFWVDTTGDCVDSNDYCGVHDNANVLTHWFSILVDGRQDDPNVSGCFSNVSPLDSDPRVAIDMGARLLFHARSLLPSSTEPFQKLREKTVLAANDLYGAEAGRRVALAWSYVGVDGEVDPLYNAGGDPSSGDTNVPPWDGVLSWKVPDDGSEWEYQLATNSDFTGDALKVGVAESYSASGAERLAKVSYSLDAGTRYYWRYREKGSGDFESCGSVLQHFTTAHKLLDLAVPSVATTSDPSSAATVVASAAGILKVVNSAQHRELEWGVGFCESPDESVTYDQVGQASIGNVYKPEFPEYEGYPMLKAGGVSEDPVLVYVRETHNGGGRGSCSYFRVQVPDVNPFSALSQSSDKENPSWEDFGDLEVRFESAGEDVDYEVLFFRGNDETNAQASFRTTNTTSSIPSSAELVETTTGLWGWAVRAWSKSGLGYRWAKEHTVTQFGPAPQRQWYRNRAGEIIPRFDHMIERNADTHHVLVRRPWDPSGPSTESGTVEVGITGNDSAATMFNWSSLVEKPDGYQSGWSYQSLSSPDRLFTTSLLANDSWLSWELTLRGWSQYTGSADAPVAVEESAGPTTVWKVDFQEDEAECFDGAPKVHLPKGIENQVNSLPCISRKESSVVLDLNSSEAGDLISSGCITPMLGGEAGISWSPTANAVRYEVFWSRAQVFGSEASTKIFSAGTGETKLWEPRVPQDMVLFQDTARVHTDSAGNDYSVCITGLEVLAYDDEDDCSNKLASEVAWIYFNEGTPHCKRPEVTESEADDPEFEGNLADFCILNPTASQCASDEDFCAHNPTASGCLNQDDHCATYPGSSGCP